MLFSFQSIPLNNICSEVLSFFLFTKLDQLYIEKAMQIKIKRFCYLPKLYICWQFVHLFSCMEEWKWKECGPYKTKGFFFFEMMPRLALNHNKYYMQNHKLLTHDKNCVRSGITLVFVATYKTTIDVALTCTPSHTIWD